MDAMAIIESGIMASVRADVVLAEMFAIPAAFFGQALVTFHKYDLVSKGDVREGLAPPLRLVIKLIIICMNCHVKHCKTMLNSNA